MSVAKHSCDILIADGDSTLVKPLGVYDDHTAVGWKNLKFLDLDGEESQKAINIVVGLCFPCPCPSTILHASTPSPHLLYIYLPIFYIYIVVDKVPVRIYVLTEIRIGTTN